MKSKCAQESSANLTHTMNTDQKQVDITLPEEAVNVLIRQGGYEQIVKKYFFIQKFLPHWPLKIDKVRKNRDFVSELLSHQVEAANIHADVILGEIAGTPSSILDIGCGLGVVDLVLQRRINPPPVIFLLDKGGTDSSLKGVKGGFHSSYIFTADLGISREMFSKNGGNTDKLHFVEPNCEAVSALGQMDLVISITSWGFHYPVETYWNAVRGLLHRQSQLFIDLRKDQGGYEILKPAFESHRIVRETGNMLRVLFSLPKDK